MELKEKLEILRREYVIDFLRAIHQGYNQAGKMCDPEKELRNRFHFLQYQNYRRVIKLLFNAGFITREGTIVKRYYKINYETLNINILED